MTNNNNTTDFGYQKIPLEDKVKRVGEVFTSVASRYDVMNDLMSFGIHRYWKRVALSMLPIGPNHDVLDCAGGTADLTLALAAKMKLKRQPGSGSLSLADINNAMLKEGRDRIIDAGLYPNINIIQLNAEALSFADASFDAITIAFGLRNVTDKAKALASFARCLKPGGRLMVLEFSKPVISALEAIYDKYSFSVLPWLGELIADDRASYQYLAESIRKHPNQEVLKDMMLQSGFDEVSVHNLSGGIVAIHMGRVF